MKKLKTYKGYNIIEIVLIILGLVSVLVSSLIFKSDWIIILHTVLCLLTVFTQAKAKLITQILGILAFSLYAFIAYKNSLFGEVIIYATVVIPFYIYGIVNWFKNKDKQNEVVLIKTNISKKEWLIMIVFLSIISVGIYFLLKFLNTEQLIVSTLSFVTMIPSIYLLARRSKWNQICFLINDLFLMFMWLILIVQGNYQLITILVCFVYQTIYDIYGIIEWGRLEKLQKGKKE